MSITGAHHQLWALRRWDPAPYWTENISPLSQALQWQHTNEATSVVTAADVIMKKIKVSYLVLVLQPASCCSWTRAANCCRSATSLPWACLMKGCSRRWVTDGRASKSFIRHLNTHTHKNKKQRKLSHTSNGRSLFKSEWIQTANHLSIVDLSGSVLTPAGDSLQVSLKVWVTNLPCSIWVPHGHYHHGPESKQALLWHSTREVLSVMCSVCQ